MADSMSIDKKDPPIKEDSDESVESNAEPDQAPAPSGNNINPQEPQQPKRKGGRKPIYATSEERKQRNRQAQAAFRERRTEYIKQLEDTLKQYQGNLHNLHELYRIASEEVLMLRYKNSLLERILLEKGIDVQAELREKTGSPSLLPTHVPRPMAPPPPIQQRPGASRYHPSRRSTSSIGKLDISGIAPLPPPMQTAAAGPAATTPTGAGPAALVHAGSPANTAPGFPLSPTAPDPDLRAMEPMSVRGSGMRHPHMMPVGGSGVRSPSAMSFYSQPGFQNHIQQLEHEYGQADMMDDAEMDTPGGEGPVSPTAAFGRQAARSDMAMTDTPAGTPVSMTAGPAGQAYPSMQQLMDSTLDWGDPFGLSASMAFPTQYPYNQGGGGMQ